MFEQSAPKDWSRAFPPAKMSRRQTPQSRQLAPPSRRCPPCPSAGLRRYPQSHHRPPPGATTGTPGTATGSSGGTSAIADSRG